MPKYSTDSERSLKFRWKVAGKTPDGVTILRASKPVTHFTDKELAEAPGPLARPGRRGRPSPRS